MKLVVMHLTGNYAVAWAVKLSRVKVVSAYPITPQTTIVEKISEFVESGMMDAKIVRVESEHSALATVFGAASSGVRAFTATSSHGLMYMYEMVWWSAGARVPIVMAIVTRTIGAPWNIWSDHSDFMSQRDTGWLMMFAEHNQEVLDSVIQLFRISEDPRVYLPGMIALDAFILSHTTEPVDIPDQSLVDSFLPGRRQPYTFKSGDPITMGNLPSNPRDNMRMRWDVHKSLVAAKKVITEVDREWSKLTGRSYGGLIECYMCSDAKYFIIGAGAWVGDMREAVDMLRSEGYEVGLIKLRFVRPFPVEELAEVMRGGKGAIVFDRSVSAGSAGPLYLDTVAHLGALNVEVPVKNVIAGIAGVDVTYNDIAGVVRSFIEEIESKGVVSNYVEWYFR